METPGSGGVYPANERNPDALRADVEGGIVSPGSAQRDYA
jgi:N-methylhydantoinase B/oxoprolinase/acetone carboxylase alpha subunit